ncbi:DNA (cytosine-5)-methyltransferase CMT3 [Dorcoceras hygrometricum]|uniref:DNA (cytosine-5-)-methyltransferase n=1 Tax=Dorcoceras hygrometricum TaxID=472368 RepID=A0A2Z7C840_9LAMI|nr:DNA (cytosine-5)-methyltransferase CMT3 [Dorcoceras hygrometricum]
MAKKRNSTSAIKDLEAVATVRKSKRLAYSVAVEVVESDLISDEEVEMVEDGECENVSNPSVDALNEEDKKLEVSVEEDEEDVEEDECISRFLGEPVPKEEARRRWPERYQKDEKEVTQARFHFLQAEVDGKVYNLGDDAYVKGRMQACLAVALLTHMVQADEGKDNYICKIVEFFEARDRSLKFTAQWYYRAVDTAIKDCNNLIEEKQIFFSEIRDDNPLDCLVKKLKLAFLPPKAKLNEKKNLNPSFDYYYNKIYLLPYCSFVNMHSDCSTDSSESNSTICSDADAETVSFSEFEEHSSERTVLDLYSGCGAMSTGLCLGSNIGGVRLVTKWAVDINQYACESLRLNHPETQVRNESAEDFLHLLKEWEKLCASFLSPDKNGLASENENFDEVEEEKRDTDEEDVDGNESEIYEVQEILSICYGDPNDNKKPGLHFKIRWKGYGAEYDTWEPLEGLSACKGKLREFVSTGYKSKMLPLPGSVDVVCGGPPCQGISGFNRFRNKDKPLEDSKNRQLLVFMDIVAYLRPKFVLMENVVDLVKFSNGFLGRYALGSLVGMGYQARMGMMVAGAYGLPQYRMRVFMWGALHTEKLPQYPLPTHNVVRRGTSPTEFEANVVCYEEGLQVQLKKELFLGDAISDLPDVENDEARDEQPYNSEPKTEFQKLIRLPRTEMPGCLMFTSEATEHSLYDHRPLQLNQDDYERVCQIPKKKGANFRDLPGVRVRADKKVEWDPDVERVLLSSGKPLVPDYAMTFVRGTSSKPFGRLWWDEIVPTVITRAEPHNHVIIHPLQDRVLSIRENARLQGFPDYYKLLGPVKERYIQVGNAVAVPVARALGYSLAMAMRGSSGEGSLLRLPQEFPINRDLTSPRISML